MSISPENPIQSWTSNALFILHDRWRRHASVFLCAVVIVMSVAALLKLGQEFYRLTIEPDASGAIDLITRYSEVHGWFAGIDFYRQVGQAMDPPASLPILWLILGWTGFGAARWLWAGLTIGALGWMAHLTIRESLATSRLEAAFAALMLLSMNGAGVAVGNGQLSPEILPVLVTGLLLLCSNRGGWRTDIFGIGLMLAALVKPSFTAPFVWLAIFVPRRLRPAIGVGVGYLTLTLFATSLTSQDLPTLIRAWLANSSTVAAQGYANVYSWLAALGLQQYYAAASLLILAGLGLWLFLNRNRDLWLLIGVAALVSRMWMYHRVYDDVVIVLPMIALFRMIKQSRAPDPMAAAAGLLLGLSVVVNLFLNSWERTRPVMSVIFIGAHTLVWLAMLGFLIHAAWRNEPAFSGQAGKTDTGNSSMREGAFSARPHVQS
jgi:hypothetical protein